MKWKPAAGFDWDDVMGIKSIYNGIKSIFYKTKKTEPEEEDDFLNFGKTLEDGIFVSKKESGYTLE